MIFKGKMVDQLLTRPAPGLRAILFYGPNEGRVREYARLAAKSVVTDLDDPFRVCQLSPADLKDDPARLADEAAALSMTGGRRVIRLSGMGDAHTESFANFLDDPQGDALIVAEAGELTRTSKLRKLFEASKHCAITACYEESMQDLDRLVIDHLRSHGLNITSDAKAYLMKCLGEDRMAARQELDKLVLYKGPPGRASARVAKGDAYALSGRDAYDHLDSLDVMDIADIPDTRDVVDILDIPDSYDIADTGGVLDIYDGKDVFDSRDTHAINDVSGIQDINAISDTAAAKDTYHLTGVKDIYGANDTVDSAARLVTLEDVSACIGDNSVQGLDDICDAMGNGDLIRLDSHLSRALELAMAPVSILRAASNHMMRLQLAAAALSGGATPDMAMRNLRPPVNFMRTRSFQAQLRLWNLPRLSRALDLLLEGEAACKTTGAPDLSLCSQALLKVAQLVRRKA